ncbi:hypothetical protein VP01_2704g4 [Puccinia sorghi]|uniref:Uncharacterized protein n=1 Tax=Puccinia sorghi TaxID=27349 RepID=A0A0L6V4B0_9BASI|nr:hypothetical protein VP01_2704g4 [Puccinia sorghi]
MGDQITCLALPPQFLLLPLLSPITLTQICHDPSDIPIPAKMVAKLDYFFGLFIIKLCSQTSGLRRVAQLALQIISERTQKPMHELLMPAEEQLLPIFGKPFQMLAFPMQIGHLNSLKFCVQSEPPLLKYSDHLMRILQEAPSPYSCLKCVKNQQPTPKFFQFIFNPCAPRIARYGGNEQQYGSDEQQYDGDEQQYGGNEQQYGGDDLASKEKKTKKGLSNVFKFLLCHPQTDSIDLTLKDGLSSSVPTVALICSQVLFNLMLVSI